MSARHDPVDQLVTLMLTDVEGSTALWREHPDEMPLALKTLDDVIDGASASFGGEVVKSKGEGDSHFVVFPLPSAAVRSACALQRSLREVTWPSGLFGLRVRIALHVGEVHARDGDYFGVPISVAARLRSTAHGGQVVVSRAIVDLAGTVADDGLEFISLGRHQIRDLPGWTEVFQLCGPGLPVEFPPLATISTGLPPVAAVVFMDVVGSSDAAASIGTDGDRELFGAFHALFTTNFAACRGEYLKQFGDGCLALFADPQDALDFVRAARADVDRIGMSVRSVLHLGRVEFVHDEPMSRAVVTASKLLKRAPKDRIGLTEVAAMMLGEHEDTTVVE
jgi:class 3 adenylate cyclase